MSTSKTDQKPKPKPKSVFDFGGFGFFPIHSDGKEKKPPKIKTDFGFFGSVFDVDIFRICSLLADIFLTIFGEFC
jgi:hypothetical protein